MKFDELCPDPDKVVQIHIPGLKHRDQESFFVLSKWSVKHICQSPDRKLLSSRSMPNYLCVPVSMGPVSRIPLCCCQGPGGKIPQRSAALFSGHSGQAARDGGRDQTGHLQPHPLVKQISRYTTVL